MEHGSGLPCVSPPWQASPYMPGSVSEDGETVASRWEAAGRVLLARSPEMMLLVLAVAETYAASAEPQQEIISSACNTA